jgi:hypothetical protein
MVNSLALFHSFSLFLFLSQSLYSSFVSPWADGPSTGSSAEPQYTLPTCYYMAKVVIVLLLLLLLLVVVVMTSESSVPPPPLLVVVHTPPQQKPASAP